MSPPPPPVSGTNFEVCGERPPPPTRRVSGITRPSFPAYLLQHIEFACTVCSGLRMGAL